MVGALMAGLGSIILFKKRRNKKETV
ncbi:LPXTG cell wall anchor domain-containing protein [Salipaludibacillus aurantiacus]